MISSDVTRDTFEIVFKRLNLGTIRYTDIHKKQVKNNQHCRFAFLKLEIKETASAYAFTTALSKDGIVRIVYDEEANLYWEVKRHLDKPLREYGANSHISRTPPIVKLQFVMKCTPVQIMTRPATPVTVATLTVATLTVATPVQVPTPVQEPICPTPVQENMCPALVTVATLVQVPAHAVPIAVRITDTKMLCDTLCDNLEDAFDYDSMQSDILADVDHERLLTTNPFLAFPILALSEFVAEKPETAPLYNMWGYRADTYTYMPFYSYSHKSESGSASMLPSFVY
jgi:hypothetical protein